MHTEATLMAFAKDLDDSSLRRRKHQRSFGRWWHHRTETFYDFRLINGRLTRVDAFGGTVHIRWNKGEGLLGYDRVPNAYEPADVTAMREAIRAGWRFNRQEHAWMRDLRPSPTNVLKQPYGGDEFEAAAKVRREWPATLFDESEFFVDSFFGKLLEFKKNKVYGAQAFVRKVLDARVQGLHVAI